LHSFERTDYNKEIFAQGVANTICGSLNLLPVCGVIVRSSANLQAGATNRSSNLMHGVWVGLFTLFLASWLEYVPLAALAGVLVYTGYRLVDLKAIQDIKRFGNAELAIYIITLVSVVMIDLLSGIVLGFVLSAARLIYVLTHFDSQVRTEAGSGSIVIELNGSATFFTLPRLADELTAIPPKREVHLFMSGLNHIDHACLEHLMGWEELYISRGGQVFVEWDHLINRFHRPLTREIGMEIESASTSRKSHETYDILAARAQIVDVEKVGSWRALAEAVALSLDMVPKYQGPAIVDGLVEQFETERFLIVSDVLIPHLMIAGIPRHEMVLVRTKQGMGSLDPKLSSVHCMVALIGPPRTSEHLNILARLSNRAEDGLARDVALAESRAVMRRLLLKHSRFVSIMVESERPSAELIGRAVWQIAKQLPPNTLIAQIYRADSELIPGGSTVLQDGDKILVLGSEAAVEQLVETYIKPLGLDDPPPTGAALRRPVETEPTPD
jgi:mannitol/fructose-specific phosphotransferase system IIA component (Ntr-type)